MVGRCFMKTALLDLVAEQLGVRLNCLYSGIPDELFRLRRISTVRRQQNVVWERCSGRVITRFSNHSGDCSCL
jgi:hypothetical protein